MIFTLKHQETYGNTIGINLAVDNHSNITGFSANSNNSIQFKFKEKTTESTGKAGSKNI